MAPTVRMFVAKFGREVLIDSEHPLAVAQRAADALASSTAPALSPSGTQDVASASSPLLENPDPSAALLSTLPRGASVDHAGVDQASSATVGAASSVLPPKRTRKK